MARPVAGSGKRVERPRDLDTGRGREIEPVVGAAAGRDRDAADPTRSIRSLLLSRIHKPASWTPDRMVSSELPAPPDAQLPIARPVH